MTDHGIDVEAVTTLGEQVTLYSLSPFEHIRDRKPCVLSITTDKAFVFISAEEAKRVRRTANKKDTG